jgi:hypothetical protein
MQDPNRDEAFKTFTDSVEIIGKLGQRLAGLQADVAAIEGLPVDDNGDAEAIIKVDASESQKIELRLSPSAMLLVKRQEIVRTTDALKAKFNEILGHAETLLERCRPAPLTQLVEAPAADRDVLEQMTRDLKQEVDAATQAGPNTADETTLVPSQRPRVGPPRLRDTLLKRHPVVATAE